MEYKRELIKQVEDEDNFTIISYFKTEYDTLDVLITRLDEEEVLLDGGVRFDGCSNWAQQQSAHYCEWYQFNQLAIAMRKAYKFAEDFYGESWCGASVDGDE